MKRNELAILLLLNVALIAAPSFLIAEEATSKHSLPNGNWPCWRGPQQNGIASSDQTPPTSWSQDTNIVWQAKVPGRGHGSPTVVGQRVFLATAEMDRELQSVLCFDRKSGKLLWKTVVHEGGLKSKNKKASLASATPACDGEYVFINFINDGAVTTTALNLMGEKVWQTKITDYTLHQGYGSSPAIFGPLVIVAGDNKAGGALVAMQRDTGKIAWRHDRPKTPNYPSPIILNAAGRNQLIMTGCDLVSSFDPLSGDKLWEFEGATTECVTSTVTNGELVYSTGGYPKNHIAAMRADGSGKVVWENKTRVYVPSMLFAKGSLFAVADAGVAMCLKADTGEELWKSRLGGTFSSSPVLVGDQIFVTDEKGKTTIFKARTDEFEKVAENQLGDEVFATPTIVGGQIFHRVAHSNQGDRQEMLYCIGE